jgi:TolB protein
VGETDGSREIFVMNVTGEGISRLFDFKHIQLAFNPHPTWSSDNKKIAFHCEPIELAYGKICLMNDDGSNPRVLQGDYIVRNFGLDWSPDGKQIVFSGLDEDGESDLFIIQVETNEIRRLTHSPGLKWAPSWSPDGRKIVFVADPNDNRDIYLINSDGSGLIRLTTHPGEDYQPAWSPVILESTP